MANRLSFYWRLMATAIAYTTFGLGGVVIYALYPILHILPLTQAKKQHYGRRIIHLSFRFFIGLMNRLGIYSYEFHGAERLKKSGQLIVANHPSLIDVVFLLSRIPETNCIVRHGLANNPFTKGPIKTANFIVNSDPEQMIADCVATLNNGSSLVIFPEGTRTPDDKTMTFQKGSANIALRAGVPIRPVSIICRPPMLQKGVKWYKIPLKRPHFIIRVEEAFSIQPHLDSDRPLTIKSRRLTRDLLTYFEQKLNKE